MKPVRLGYVDYLNTAPLVEGVAAWRDARLVPAVPARLIGMLEARAIDLGLISVIDAACHDVRVLPVGMIGCDGPTLTVGLFSRVRPERIERVHADSDSHTSVALLRLILARRTGRLPDVVPLDAAHLAGLRAGIEEAAWPEALLLIGDKVVTGAPPAGVYPHRLDLGAEWKELTGMPFVYAVWACRAEDADRPEVHAAAAVLDRARRRNALRTDWLVARHAPDRRWPRGLAEEYLGLRLRYDLGADHRRAAEHFVAEAAALGLCPARGLRWLEPCVPSAPGLLAPTAPATSTG
ncbi:MAG TPA: menaquinone biosynthesis protein [Phycisphaerales bacterium]|nr:menaquinone biosynthesis protein [Phycisphaerales bacterium]